MPPDTETRQRSSLGKRGTPPDVSRMGRYLRKVYVRFIKIRGTPRQIAGGMAIGLFIGFTPTLFQIVMAVFLAALFKANKFAAAAGVMITNPLTAPFIYSVTYMIGASLIGLDKPFSLRAFTDLSAFVAMVQQAPRIFIALFLGGAIVGVPAAVIGYGVSFRAVEKYQTDLKARMARQKERLKQKIGRKRKKKTAKAKKKQRRRSVSDP